MTTAATTAIRTMTIKEKPSVQLRHEYKHSIHAADDAILSARLRKLFQHDTHADSHGVYRVSSLYYDTPSDRALRQKVDGLDRREKFRLRYYDGDLSFLRLEKKVKLHGLCAKYSARLSPERARRLLGGDIEFLADSDDALLLEFYSKLRGQLLAPKTVVRYEREAFLYAPGNVRVTIDRDLRTGLGDLSFIDPHAPLVSVSDGLAVLEVKYDAFLPDVVRMAVQVADRRAASYSKYAVCRRYD